MSPEAMKAMMKETLKEMLGGPPPEVQKLPGQAVPIEDVELIGEKINYKRALGVDDSPAREANKWFARFRDHILIGFFLR